MPILTKVKQFFAPIPLFIIFIMTAFIGSISTQARAEYYYQEVCENPDIFWENAPTYHLCKLQKKYYNPSRRIKHPVHQYYVKTIIVPISNGYNRCNSCGAGRCCYDDCCGNYNPDLTTGDDDPSVYPDLDIDR